MSPIDDFCFVDAETTGVAHGEAGRSADRAVDVNDKAASSADQVMMVVTDAILIPGRRAGGLDAAYQVLLDKRREGVVHRLTRYGPDVRPNIVCQFVCRGVGMGRYGAHGCEPLSRHLDAVLTQLIFQGVVHGANCTSKID